MEKKLLIGKDTYLDVSKLNRHGFITGSTGSGKTVTLKVIVEQLAKNGIPVFLSDIKGDLSSFIEPLEMDEKIAKRLELIGIEEFEPRSFSTEIFDVFGENGIPLRTTISGMGPLLLSKILGLNDTQEGVLNIAFSLADERNLLLVDIKDLRAVLNFINENKKDLQTHYGNISTASIGAILRSLLIVEKQGGDKFFGEPDFNINDLFRFNQNGEGIINILNSEKLYRSPVLYAIFLLWLLGELFENLEEVGDLDKPKMVFFFDEAHLLFNNGSKALLEKIELIVRLIRSKGVGVFFITQKATDIPEEVLSQLSNRIQHSLRAFTPKEQKEVKAIADSFRQDDDMDLVEEILNLKTGEAIVSVLDENSTPTLAKKVTICPPLSKIGIANQMNIQKTINMSPLLDKYADCIDKVSAFEVLELEKKERLKRLEIEAQEKELLKQEEKRQKEIDKQEQRNKNKTTIFERFTNNLVGTIGRTVGREITRGIFGTKRRY